MHENYAMNEALGQTRNLKASVEDFLRRLGREVEELSDSRLLVRQRTALTQDERKIKVVDSDGDRLLKTAINVVASDVQLPDDLDDYPQTFYFKDFLDHTVQAGRLSSAICSDERILAEREFFVPQHVAASAELSPDDSVAFFRTWLRRPESRLLAILAPAGYGKTALTCEMSYELAQDYLGKSSGSEDPFPFLVPFGEFRRLASFEAMILSSLQRHGVTDYTAPAFASLVEWGRVILMLDGFDELLEERPDEARKNLRELIETLSGSGKVIVTARSTFFRTSDDVADFLEYGLEPEEVEVIDLQPFDREQRTRVLSKRFETQRQIENVSRFIEAENVREAMGSPLLLRETIDALVSTEEEARLDRTAGRKDLFDALEQSVYARERLRHGHLFSDETQRGFLTRLASALLTDNARGYDFELVQVLAHEAADDESGDTDLAQLADHHFLTVDHASDEARFNHQVFREYFQARGLIEACEGGSGEWIFGLLAVRPIPEEVRAFLVELDAAQALPPALFSEMEAVVRPSEQLVENLGALIAAYGQPDLFSRFLELVPNDVGLQIDVRGLDLSETDWSGRVILRGGFHSCNLSRASFTDCMIAELSLTAVDLSGAAFAGATIDSLVMTGDPRIFGTPDAMRALEACGADCGLASEAAVQTLTVTRRQQIVRMVHDRLYRFYRPGQAGPEGSKWDSSIKENNLFGGVSPGDRKFTKRKLVPAMRRSGLVSSRRAHGEIIYDLADDGEDDARALIERDEVVGKVKVAVDALTT